MLLVSYTSYPCHHFHWCCRRYFLCNWCCCCCCCCCCCLLQSCFYYCCRYHRRCYWSCCRRRRHHRCRCRRASEAASKDFGVSFEPAVCQPHSLQLVEVESISPSHVRLGWLLLRLLQWKQVCFNGNNEDLPFNQLGLETTKKAKGTNWPLRPFH